MHLFVARHNTQLLGYFSFKCRSSGCFSPSVDQSQTICFPSVLIGRCLRKIDQDQVNELTLIVPFWHNQTWFPLLLARLIDTPLILPSFSRIITNPNGEIHPMVAQNSLTLAARNNIQGHRISDDSAAWRKGTEKSYSSAWGKWLLWCNEGKIDPFPSSVGPVLNFLTTQFHEGKQYSTLNSYRSATLPEILKLMGNLLDSIQWWFNYSKECLTNVLLHQDTNKFGTWVWS